MTEKRLRKSAKDGRWYIGSCDVDSGQIYVVDPCYIKYYESLHDEKKWSGFCDSRFPEGNSEEPAVEMYAGVVTSTYFGDGTYPVYVTTKDGRPKKMEIIFTRNTTLRDENTVMEYDYEEIVQ